MKKRNRCIRISVVVVDKGTGKIRYLKTIDISSDEKEIEQFYQSGKK